MKRLMITMALIGAIAFNANAQSNVENLLKAAEKAVLLADQNPQDGQKQLAAARALAKDSLGDKRDLDRSMTYANKALDIAKAQTELKDTLLGNTCLVLGRLYLEKRDVANGFDYLEMAVDAYERELGKYNPATNGTKMACFFYLIGVDPRRAFPFVLDAFYNNEKAPENQKIKNMDWAAMALSIATEYLMADYDLRFKNVVPLVTFEGQKYLVLQLSDWHVGTPFTKWLAPMLIRQQIGDTSIHGDVILMNDNTNEVRRITPDYKNRVNMDFNFKYDIKNPREFLFHESNAYIINFPQDRYDKLIELYNEFINKGK